MAGIVIRAAHDREARALSALAVRSAAYWGHDPSALAQQESLTVHAGEVTTRRITVAERDARLLGFYALDVEPGYAEVGMFYVEPAHIGTGVGRRLWEHLVRTTRSLGVEELALGAEPMAEGFYLKMGMSREREIVHDGQPMVWMVHRAAAAVDQGEVQPDMPDSRLNYS